MKKWGWFEWIVVVLLFAIADKLHALDNTIDSLSTAALMVMAALNENKGVIIAIPAVAVILYLLWVTAGVLFRGFGTKFCTTTRQKVTYLGILAVMASVTFAFVMRHY
jgi:hypothetical protein